MSTSATINFMDGTTVKARVYRHFDGYDIETDLQRFLDAVAKQCPGDTRFDDAEYLAAKYVVWQAGEYAKDKTKPLVFNGVGVLNPYAEYGTEFTATVHCDSEDRPEITIVKGV